MQSVYGYLVSIASLFITFSSTNACTLCSTPMYNSINTKNIIVAQLTNMLKTPLPRMSHQDSCRHPILLCVSSVAKTAKIGTPDGTNVYSYRDDAGTRINVFDKSCTDIFLDLYRTGYHSDDCWLKMLARSHLRELGVYYQSLGNRRGHTHEEKRF